MVCDRCGELMEHGASGIEVVNRRHIRVSSPSGDTRMCALCMKCGCTLLKQVTAFVSQPDRITIWVSDSRLLRRLHVVMRALNLGLVPSNYTQLEITDSGDGKALVECGCVGDTKLYTVDLVKGTLSPVPFLGKSIVPTARPAP